MLPEKKGGPPWILDCCRSSDDDGQVWLPSQAGRAFGKSALVDGKWSALCPFVQAMSKPRIVPVAEANLSASMPICWSMETNKFGSG